VYAEVGVAEVDGLFPTIDVMIDEKVGVKGNRESEGRIVEGV